MGNKTFLITLKGAIKTELKDADLAEKADKIVFLYPKNEATISLQVHNQLAVIKAKTEFVEVCSEKIADMLVQFAYLTGLYTGQGSDVSIISESPSITALQNGNFKIYPDFKSAIKGIQSTAVRKPRTPRAPKEEQPVETKATKEVIEEFPVKNVPMMSTKKTTTPKGRPKKVEVEKPTVDDLKSLLGNYKTDMFNPQNHCMSIFEATKKSIKENSPMDECIAEAMMIDSLAESANKCLKSHYKEIITLVKKMA